MAEAGYYISARNINQIQIPSPYPAEPKFLSKLHRSTSTVIKASSKRNEFSLITRKSNRTPRRLITISTADGRWHGNWSCDYIFSLQELKLEDLAEDGHKDAEVFISICIQKHASFGLSVDGRIITSFTRKCSNCSSPYCREIDTNFNVWVLQSSRHSNSSTQLPENGTDDPSLSLQTLSLSLWLIHTHTHLTLLILQVIYVKPGCEADLDSLIQDTIRLTTSVKETCSESCEKAEPRLQYIGEQKVASTDRRWSRLLELRNAYT